MTFLDDVLAVKEREAAALRVSLPACAEGIRPGLAAALHGPGLAVIAEIKRRSPSKGSLSEDLDAERTARAYAEGGAAAISCLTDREFFGARTDDLALARHARLPVLRKDFLIEEVQIEESALLGASAVLLIVRILDQAKLEFLLDRATRRGLEAVVEVHDEAEIDRAVEAGASIIGVNNRDLGTLEVDPGRVHRLRPFIPKGVLSVAESGVRTRDDVTRIEAAGYDAVLIGETLAASPDPARKLRELTGRKIEVSI